MVSTSAIVGIVIVIIVVAAVGGYIALSSSTELGSSNISHSNAQSSGFDPRANQGTDPHTLSCSELLQMASFYADQQYLYGETASSNYLLWYNDLCK